MSEEDDALLEPTVSFPEVPEFNEVEEEGPDDTSQFDRRWRDPFIGLLYVGQLSEEVTVYGHKFIIGTPSQSDRIQAGIIHKPYINTMSGELSWATVTVASYLKKIDGQDLPHSIGPVDTDLLDRFNWVKENINYPVIMQLFEKCLILDSKVDKALEELESLGKS